MSFFSSTATPSQQNTGNGFQKAGTVASIGLEGLEYVYWLSLFAQSIIDGIKKLDQPISLSKSIPALKFAYINKGFLAYMDGVLVFKDLKDILLRDSKGRWIWQRHFQYASEKGSWTVAHGVDFFGFLNFVNALKMSELTSGVLGLVSLVFKVVGCSFAIWDRSRSIAHNERKRKRCCELKAVWKKRSLNWDTKDGDCDQRISICREKLKFSSNLKALEVKSIQEKLEKWNSIKGCNDNEKLKRFCEASSEREGRKIYKYDSKLILSIASILYNSSLLLLAAIGLAAYFTGWGNKFPVKITLVALPIVFTSIQLGRLVMQRAIKVRPVPKLDAKLLLASK